MTADSVSPVLKLEQSTNRPNERIYENFLQLEGKVGSKGRASRSGSHAGDEITKPGRDSDTACGDDLGREKSINPEIWFILKEFVLRKRVLRWVVLRMCGDSGQ